MKKTSKVRITITFEQEDAQKVEYESTVEMLDKEIKDLDKCEQHILEGAYEAMRGALAKQFSELSKKK